MLNRRQKSGIFKKHKKASRWTMSFPDLSFKNKLILQIPYLYYEFWEIRIFINETPWFIKFYFVGFLQFWRPLKVRFEVKIKYLKWNSFRNLQNDSNFGLLKYRFVKSAPKKSYFWKTLFLRLVFVHELSWFSFEKLTYFSFFIHVL